MNETERQIRCKLRDDFIHYASKCLKIRSKSGEIRPFVLNQAQKYIHDTVEKQRREKGYVRVIIVKGRQIGCSTYTEGRFYWRVTHSFGLRAFILTHDSDATNNLFEMAVRYHEHCPTIVRPILQASNAKELIFSGLDSGYRIGTAGNKGVGRSSTIQLFHGSEVSMWPNAHEHASGILQAIPKADGTEVFLESTARGIGNYFHQQWQLAEAGISDFIPIFIPWYWQPEYTIPTKDDLLLDDTEEMLVKNFCLSLPQIVWRRYKIIELSANGIDGTKAFMQEYPCTATEAFQTTGEDSYIVPDIVVRARKTQCERHGGMILGVDPARFGDDRSSIIRRCGRVAYSLESYAKKDTMEITGIVHKIIMTENPIRVCIDIGGLGAGVYDRLKELGHGDVLVAVNGGSIPLDNVKYMNKRAEMWGEMKAWLNDWPCEIPDIDSLHSDLCGLKYKYDSKSRLVLEKKEDMKKRGIRSPDEADALALTFACPPTALIETRKKNDNNIAKNIMNSFNTIDKLKKNAYS